MKNYYIIKSYGVFQGYGILKGWMMKQNTTLTTEVEFPVVHIFICSDLPWKTPSPKLRLIDKGPLSCTYPWPVPSWQSLRSDPFRHKRSVSVCL